MPGLALTRLVHRKFRVGVEVEPLAHRMVVPAGELLQCPGCEDELPDEGQPVTFCRSHCSGAMGDTPWGFMPRSLNLLFSDRHRIP